jgi:hypothetical protein
LVNADWNRKKDKAQAREKSEMLKFEKSKNVPLA